MRSIYLHTFLLITFDWIEIETCGQFHKAEKFVITKIIFVITKKNFKCL